jgi:hypothetical protein
MEVEGEYPDNSSVASSTEEEEVWDDDEELEIDDLEEGTTYSLKIQWKSHESVSEIIISKITELSKTELIILTEDDHQYAVGGKFDVPGAPRYRFYY